MSYFDKDLDDFLIEKIEIIKLLDFENVTSDGLFSGKLGLIHFYLTLYKDRKDTEFLSKISDILSSILERIETGESDVQLNSSFSNGLSGLGYMLSTLINEDILENDFKDQIDSINEIVFNACEKCLENNDFDFISGSIGMLYYLNFSGATEFVERLVNKIYNIYVENNFQFYNNNGSFEGIHFGYAHGLPGIAKVLGEIPNNDKSKFIVRSILNDLLEIISSNEKYIDNIRYFLPRSIYIDSTQKKDFNWRPVLTWSNSDLNFSTLVYSISNESISSSMYEAANEIALNSTKRQHLNHTMVSDHRFFFGSSGVAQLYSKLYDHTKLDHLHQAYLFWLSKTLNYLQDNNTKIEQPRLDFINNLPGAFLTLYEYKHPTIKGWDKIFLI